MNSKQFLLWGGVVLIVVGLLGFIGIFGPTSEQSIFGSFWWFDNVENWAHGVLGVVAVLAAYLLSAGMQKWLTMLIGIIAILVGLYSILGEANLFGAMLQNPADTVLHLAIGVWALWASMRKQEMMMQEGGMGGGMGGM